MSAFKPGDILNPAFDEAIANAKTKLGKRLLEIRAKAIAKGMTLLTADEILKELEDRRK